MSGVGRRTLYRKSVTEEYLNSTPEPGENEEIALVQAPRGSNIIEVGAKPGVGAGETGPRGQERAVARRYCCLLRSFVEGQQVKGTRPHGADIAWPLATPDYVTVASSVLLLHRPTNLLHCG